MPDEVLYEETDGIAIIAINRPEKKNTLTNKVVQGIADGIDKASRSKEVAAIVLRGVGDTFTAGYDLTNRGEPWDTPYGAPDIEKEFESGSSLIKASASQDPFWVETFSSTTCCWMTRLPVSISVFFWSSWVWAPP